MTPGFISKLGSLVVLLGIAGVAGGCSSSLAQPFEKMKTGDITIYRLQNYEPQAAPAAAGIPGAPAGLQDMLAKGAALLQQWGLPAIPGLTPPAGGTAPAADQAQRFYNYRILAIRPVSDTGQKEDVAKLFGTEGNFSDKPDTCMYPEFGVAMMGKDGTRADFVVSTSCEQVRALNFQWPYSKIGVPPDTSRKLVELVKKVFGGN